MLFTVEVEKKGKDENFIFSILNLFHKECMGGGILTIGDLSEKYWRLTCTRCNAQNTIRVSVLWTISVIKTAIDGEKREIGVYFPGYDKVFVVQRV